MFLLLIFLFNFYFFALLQRKWRYFNQLNINKTNAYLTKGTTRIEISVCLVYCVYISSFIKSTITVTNTLCPCIPAIRWDWLYVSIWQQQQHYQRVKPSSLFLFFRKEKWKLKIYLDRLSVKISKGWHYMFFLLSFFPLLCRNLFERVQSLLLLPPLVYKD